jgi:guanine deaminase
VTSARHLDASEPDNRIDIVAAFWMATVGGADLLGIDAGLLRPANVFDALAVDLGAVGVMTDLDDHARTFEKLVRRSNDRAITRVWVDGVDVVTRSDASGRGSG